MERLDIGAKKRGAQKTGCACARRRAADREKQKNQSETRENEALQRQAASDRGG
jgi:hypothetical protein